MKSQRGAIGNTWWSQRWISVLESFGMGARLARGKTYARQGQVVSIDIEAGTVHAKVQGSKPRPYNVSITLEPISEHDWETIIGVMAGRAVFLAKLLCGEIPQAIEEAFVEASVPLFPSRMKDLETDCSCPDDANPCKHIAAVHFILAEMFDGDPFLIFKLRGMPKEVLLEALRNTRTAPMEEEACLPANGTGLESPAMENTGATTGENIDRFWDMRAPLPAVDMALSRPAIDKALLKRAGKSPFSIGDQNLTDILSELYDHVAEVTWQRLREDPENP